MTPRAEDTEVDKVASSAASECTMNRGGNERQLSDFIQLRSEGEEFKEVTSVQMKSVSLASSDSGRFALPKVAVNPKVLKRST